MTVRYIYDDAAQQTVEMKSVSKSNEQTIKVAENPEVFEMYLDMLAEDFDESLIEEQEWGQKQMAIQRFESRISDIQDTLAGDVSDEVRQHLNDELKGTGPESGLEYELSQLEQARDAQESGNEWLKALRGIETAVERPVFDVEAFKESWKLENYEELRKSAYGDIGAQLGMMQDGTWDAHVAAVKARFPKPVE